MNRRVFIGAAAALAAVELIPQRGDGRPALRPPGALPPGRFEAACIGCLRCAEVCPTRCIRFDREALLESALPHLELQDQACVLCMRCTAACPTGALEPVRDDPEDIARSVHIGEPVLARDRCLSWTGKGNCRLCYLVCPYPDRAVFVVGPSLAPSFEPRACVGCGLCVEACPDTARAIQIVPPSGRTS